jgi:hypothetical protein
MTRSEEKGLEDKQVERALQQGDAVFAVVSGSHSTQVSTFFGSNVNPKKKRLVREPGPRVVETLSGRIFWQESASEALWPKAERLS